MKRMVLLSAGFALSLCGCAPYPLTAVDPKRGEANIAPLPAPQADLCAFWNCRFKSMYGFDLIGRAPRR